MAVTPSLPPFIVRRFGEDLVKSREVFCAKAERLVMPVRGSV